MESVETQHDSRVDHPRQTERLHGCIQNGTHFEAELARLEAVAHWLDNLFRIPGTDVRFGLDSVVGLIPGIGDAGTAVTSLYVVHKARQLGASNLTIARMLGNTGIDMLVGIVPLAGDLFDVGFKANTRNVALLRRHLEKKEKSARSG